MTLPGHGLQSHAEPAENRLSHEGQPHRGGAADAGLVGGDRHLSAAAPGRGRPSTVDPARRAALRQRAHPPGARAEQGPQGRDREVALDGRLQRGLRPRLGLPRAADRAPGRQDARPGPAGGGRAAGDGSDREDPALSRVRAEVHRHPARGIQAARRLRRLGPSVHDDGPRLRGGHRARVRAPGRPRARLQGPQAGALVHALQDRSGPGRGRVRGRAGAVGLRSLPAGGPAAGVAGGAEALAGDLDHHAMDAAGQPRHRGASRGGLRRPRGSGRDTDRRRQARRHLRRAGRSGAAAPAGHSARSRAGRSRVPPCLARPYRQGRGGAVRGDGHRHRPRAHRPRPRRGGLRSRPRRWGCASTTRWTTTGASSPRSSTLPG